LELARVLPLSDEADPAAALACAAGVAAAAGSPWGAAFPAADATPATDGAFDGVAATAGVAGVPYRLGPLTDADVGPAVDRHLPVLRERGTHVLVLRRASQEQPRALFALRPRLAAGVADLVQACRRHGVELGLFGAGDARVAASVAARAGAPL